MLIQMFCVSRSWSFYRCPNGGVAPIFAVALLAVTGTVGLAIDFGRAFAVKQKMQASLDAAVLAGIAYTSGAEALSGVLGGESQARRREHAEQVFAIKVTQAQLTARNVSFEFAGAHLVGQADFDVNTTFARVLGRDALNVSMRSIGTAEPVRVPMCVMAMHPTRKHTLELNDSVSVVGPDCHFYGNSDHFDDVVDPHTPENFLVGKSVQAIGFGHHYIVNVSPPLEHAPELIPDPLATMVIPSPGSCTFNNIVVSGGFRMLSPGNYCGGLTIQNGANVMMQSGVYSISGGSFVVSSSEVNGQDLAIALADGAATIKFTNATVRLKGRRSGTYAGIVVMGARVERVHQLTGSTVDLHGVVYLPNGSFVWRNNGTPTMTASWTAWIVDGFSWLGNGTIRINFDINHGDVPYPNSLRVIPRPGTARLLN